MFPTRARARALWFARRGANGRRSIDINPSVAAGEAPVFARREVGHARHGLGGGGLTRAAAHHVAEFTDVAILAEEICCCRALTAAVHGAIGEARRPVAQYHAVAEATLGTKAFAEQRAVWRGR